MRHDVEGRLAASACAIFLLLLPGSCSSNHKSSHTSNLTALDDYGSGQTEESNRCRADAVDRDAEALADAADVSDRLRPTLGNALATIPQGVRQFFRDDLRGRITVSNRAKEMCNEGRSSQDKVTSITPEACFVVSNALSNRPELKVILPADKAGIGHNTVKVFGFMVAQLYSNYRPSIKFATLKLGLSRTFFTDLVSTEVFGESDVDVLLGTGIHRKLTENAKDPNEDILRGIKFEKGGGPGSIDGDQEQFEEEIFAEAFDSYYCNSVDTYSDDTLKDLKNSNDDREERNRLLRKIGNTRRFMKDAFPETYKVFVEMDRLLKVADTSSGSESEPEEDQEDLKSDAETNEDDSDDLTEEDLDDLCHQFPKATRCKDRDKDDAEDSDKDKDTDKDDVEKNSDGFLKDQLCELFPWAKGCRDRKDDDNKSDREKEGNSDQGGDRDSNGSGSREDKLATILAKVLQKMFFRNNDREPRIRAFWGGFCGRRLIIMIDEGRRPDQRYRRRR